MHSFNLSSPSEKIFVDNCLFFPQYVGRVGGRGWIFFAHHILGNVTNFFLFVLCLL